MRKTASPEQQAKTAERRERFRQFADQLAKLGVEERTQLAARLPGLCNVEGHLISEGNTCLVFMQMPTATMIGGFHSWLKAGRAVRKGESGIMIWIPTQRKQKPDDDPNAPKRQGFIMGTVFDVSQTEVVNA